MFYSRLLRDGQTEALCKFLCRVVPVVERMLNFSLSDEDDDRSGSVRQQRSGNDANVVHPLHWPRLPEATRTDPAPPHCTALVFSCDGSLVAGTMGCPRSRAWSTLPGLAAVWRCPTAAAAAAAPGCNPSAVGAAARPAALGAAAVAPALAGAGATARPIAHEGAGSPLVACAFHPSDPTVLAAGGLHGEVYVLRLAGGAQGGGTSDAVGSGGGGAQAGGWATGNAQGSDEFIAAATAATAAAAAAAAAAAGVDALQVQHSSGMSGDSHRSAVASITWLRTSPGGASLLTSAIMGAGSSPHGAAAASGWDAASGWLLLTAAADGQLLAWDAADLSSPLARIDLASQHYVSPSSWTPCAVSCAAIPSSAARGSTGGSAASRCSQWLLVGTEGGNALRYDISAAVSSIAANRFAYGAAEERSRGAPQQQLLQQQQRPPLRPNMVYDGAHVGAVTAIDASPLQPTLFLTGGDDGTVVLRSVLRRTPLLTLEPPSPSSAGAVTAVRWSPHPALFGVATATGWLHVYDLAADPRCRSGPSYSSGPEPPPSAPSSAAAGIGGIGLFKLGSGGGSSSGTGSGSATSAAAAATAAAATAALQRQHGGPDAMHAFAFHPTPHPSGRMAVATVRRASGTRVWHLPAWMSVPASPGAIAAALAALPG